MNQPPMDYNRVICTVSGGLSSAYCAWWTLQNYPKNRVVLYFNDTKWEHKDLYRFLDELEQFLQHPITYDVDGRNPEQLFYDEKALANNRMPFCSRILKAERLQNFYQEGDVLVFGFSLLERKRAYRLVQVYQKIAAKYNIWPSKLVFPLIENQIPSTEVVKFFKNTGIKAPELYELGFQHNNCSGGCVRQGIGQWVHLYKTLPEIYAERERVEESFRAKTGKDVHFLKQYTLKNLRHLIEEDSPLVRKFLADFDTELGTECVGICESLA